MSLVPSFGRVLPFLLGASLWLAAAGARAQNTVRPRFVILVDSSGSMTENAGRVRTHGDGSEQHPGCDLDNNGEYDDSKLYQAKVALNDTIAAFGTAEFSFARYDQNELGQVCTTTIMCTQQNLGANVCQDGRCAHSVPSNTTDYNECTGGNATNNGCIRCAAPDTDPTHVYYNGNVCCPRNGPKSGGYGMAGDVLVAFPNAAGSNVSELLMWIDGKEDFPAGTNKELRATGTTPIGGSLNAVRDWLVNDASGVGPSPGILNRDPLAACRSYNVILVTDGLEVSQCVQNCGVNGSLAADRLVHACTNDGIWDPFELRCEIADNPANTREIKVKTYVIGYTVNDPSLNAIAAAGGTGRALLANNSAELTARIGDIVSASVVSEKCDCQDNTCDGMVDESFATKGAACVLGIGRCKRAGFNGCKSDGSGLICSSSPSGICPALEITPGLPVTEVCGAAPGCEAPTAQDCADDDCDGLVDENMSCSCTSKPEICNGLDDDCNGKIDDIIATACGLNVGECRPGTTVCVDDGQGGKRSACVGGTEATAELCDGKDNDCDGVIDGFGLACYPAGMVGCVLAAETTSCGGAPANRWTCTGVCQMGVLTCADGMCGACGNAITPSTEVACDRLDNDCDGMVDEGFDIGSPCGPGTSGVGECRPGVIECVNNGLECVGGQGPIEEMCNGRDDDCDGMLDNIPGPCGVIRGECRPGRWRCVAGMPLCEQAPGPRPEICDGLDNDCDGVLDNNLTDPDLVRPTMCGSTVGVCRPGTLACLGGGKFCTGGVQPEAERCNGLDDNCDGMIDNGVPSAGTCPPPGLPTDTPAQGECRPGMNTCGRLPNGQFGFMCQGGTGPAPELCDGKDNDCDGTIDDQARCPTDQACAEGECAPLCQAGAEFPCPADRVCKDGVCVYSECVKRPCPMGTRCDPRRGCVDRCEGVACPSGSACEAGVCTNCFVKGCGEAQVCRGAACEADPCFKKICPSGSYCRAGVCTKSCASTKCAAGQSCRDGACVADRCAGKSCASGEFCDPKDGRCRPNPCDLVQCVRGQTCVAQTATCSPDPCLVTVCKSAEVCEVQADGRAECVLPRAETLRVSVGGSGCGCVLGAAPPARQVGGGAGVAAFALAVMVRRLVRRKRVAR